MARRDHERRPSTTTGKFDGRLHVRRCPLHDSEKPLATGLCHCNRCRPQSGSAFSTVIFVHINAITITGETAVFDDIGASGLRVLRRHCARCGSPLTTESEATPGIFFVKVGTIDSNEWFHPDMEMFVTPQALGQSSRGRHAVRRQSNLLRGGLVEPVPENL